MLIENIFTLCFKIWYEIGEKIHISYDMCMKAYPLGLCSQWDIEHLNVDSKES